VRYVEGIQKENLEYRTRNEKLIDEINAMRVKLADLKAKKLSVEQDYRLDKKRLKNLLKMGENVDEAEIKSYKREVQQLKTTLATLRRGVESRDKKIKAQGQELRMRAREISRLKKAVANSVLRKRK
jgi:predicted  nucleic acid-binding Zn-ribbon protein